MKKISLTLLGVLMCVFVFAQGVNFQKLSLKEALTKAKAENKIVMVDCYTTWCGPCKNMANVVFPKKESGDFFNPRVVAIKFDMEKPAGKEIGKTYGVPAYPTFLFINPDATLKAKLVGGGSAEKFIARYKKAMEPNRDITKLAKKYASNKISKKELLVYSEVLEEAYDRALTKKVTEELFNKLTAHEKVSKEYWPLVKGMVDISFIKRNLKYLKKNVGEEEINNFLSLRYNNLLSNILIGRAKNVELASLREEINSFNLPNAESINSILSLVEVKETGDLNKFMGAIIANKSQLNGQLLAMSISSMASMVQAPDMEIYNAIKDFEKKLTEGESEEAVKSMYSKYMSMPLRRAYPGVWFEKDVTLEQLIKMATRYKRPIFIDCYTTWCGPCKNMSTKVLPMKECGDYFNSKFISAKFDMEKGEGPAIAKKYGVHAYPTFLILNPDGTLLHKVIGGGNASGFIKRVDEAFDPNKALGSLKKKFEEGNTDKDFLLNYAKVLRSNYDEKGASEVDAKLLSELTEAEKVSKDYWGLFKAASYKSAPYNYLSKNKDAFVLSLGRETVEAPLMSMATKKIIQVMGGRDKTSIPELTAFVKEFKSMKLKDYKELSSLLKMATYQESENIAKLTKTASKVLPSMEATTNPFWSLAGKILPKCDAKQKATWMSIGQGLVKALPENLQKRGAMLLERLK